MAAVLRAVLGYCILIFLTRIVGRRPGKQISPFEFILIFFIGGLSLTYMVGDDRSVTNALCQISAIALTHYFIVRARQRFSKVALLTDGTPLLLLERGKWHTEVLKHMRIQDDDVMATARDRGIERLEQIDYAVLERNGEIAVLPAKTQPSENSNG